MDLWCASDESHLILISIYVTNIYITIIVDIDYKQCFNKIIKNSSCPTFVSAYVFCFSLLFLRIGILDYESGE